MPRLEMGADHQDKTGVTVIGRRPVQPLPQLIPQPCRGGTDIGMAVVAVNAPCLQDPLHVSVVPGPADVIHDFVPPSFEDQPAYLRRDLFQDALPGNSFPCAFASLSGSLQRIENAFGIVDLVDGGRAFGAVASPARGMVRISFHAPDRPRFLVYISKEAASGFAIEANRRNHGITLLDTARPGSGIVLDPVVPLARRRGLLERGDRHPLG